MFDNATYIVYSINGSDDRPFWGWADGIAGLARLSLLFLLFFYVVFYRFTGVRFPEKIRTCETPVFW